MSVEMDKLNEIAVKVSGMESTQKAQAEAIGKMAHSVDRLVDKLDKSDDIAREAMQSAKSAHHRIDDLKKDQEGVRVGQRWLIGTTISAVALFLTGIGLLWNLLKG